MERPPIDPHALLASWMEWERGETPPGQTLANLKKGQMREALESLAEKIEPRSEQLSDDARIPRPPAARLGPPAPWLRLPPEQRRPTLIDVRRACKALPTPRRPLAKVPGMQGAAVLAPFFAEADDDQARVILTKRPDTMPSHRGDIAFPGGKFNPDLDRHLLDSALREAEEEIGLHRGAVEVLGELDTLSTVTTRFLVAPFIGVLRHRPVLTPHPEEVAGVFDVALAELLADGVHREEQWGIGGISRPVHFFELEDEVVWGVTARILTSFLIFITANG